MQGDIEILNKAEGNMNNVIDNLVSFLNRLRVERANSSLVDLVKVNICNNKIPIKQIASITTPDTKTLVIQVWDKKLVSDVEKAIIDSNLGLAPNTKGQTIKLYIPYMSEERRKEIVKKAGEYSEQARVSIRNIRKNMINLLKKRKKGEPSISEDRLKNSTRSIQSMTDTYIDKVNNLFIGKST